MGRKTKGGKTLINESTKLRILEKSSNYTKTYLWPIEAQAKRSVLLYSRPDAPRQAAAKVIKLHKTIYFCKSYISLQDSSSLVGYKITATRERYSSHCVFIRNPLSKYKLLKSLSQSSGNSKKIIEPEFSLPIAFYLLCFHFYPLCRPIVLIFFQAMVKRVLT